jgi:hypothetical protein
MFVAGNPVKLIDPDGRRIINPYNKYKIYKGLEQILRNRIENASTWKEKRKARKELRNSRGNIRGYNNYEKEEKLLVDYKKKNKYEYDKANSLEFNGVEVDVVIKLSSRRGTHGELGRTQAQYESASIVKVTEFKTGESYELPTKIIGDKIEITLYRNGQTVSVLANEFGDAIFMVENPRRSYSDEINKLPYWDRAATHFSFDYQNYIMEGGTRPEPKDY